jgi:bifunctional non-homologous end joining protein LigD
MEPKVVELHNNKAGHNKIYIIKLIDEGDGRASVLGFNGKLGQQLKQRIKAANVPLQKALAKFDEVLKEKLSAAHGYEIAYGDVPAPMIASGKNGRSGFMAELPKDMPLEALERLICDDRYTFERKRDGVNLSVRKIAEKSYQAINKNGDVIAIDPALAKVLDGVKLPTFLVCGELESTAWFVWDIVEAGGTDLHDYLLEDRRTFLQEFFGKVSKRVVVSEVARGEKAKRALVAQLHSIRAEGVVAKLDMPFQSGESGHSYKIKFVAVTDVVVGPKEAKKEGKRSFGMYAFAGDKLRYLGSCGCPEKYSMPQDRQVVEVRYLYLDNHLIQPKFFGVVRNDKDAGDCSVATMKVKATE